MRHLPAILILAAILSIPSTLARSTPLPEPLGKQLLVSVSEDWSSFHATLYGFSRRDEASPWKEDFAWPAVLGSNGMGWGLGVHGWNLSTGPVKQEGDKRSPAGLFHLPAVFGYASAKDSGVSYIYRQLTETTFDVDDPSSPFYNQIVNRTPEDPKQWKSAEVMLRPDGAYRLGVFVAHNDPNFKPIPLKSPVTAALPVPGKSALGSCIFIHIWKSANHPTIGCTAISPENMEHLVHWLNAGSQPMLLQLPSPEYNRLQKSWILPNLTVLPW